MLNWDLKSMISIQAKKYISFVFILFSVLIPFHKQKKYQVLPGTQIL